MRYFEINWNFKKIYLIINTNCRNKGSRKKSSIFKPDKQACFAYSRVSEQHHLQQNAIKIRTTTKNTTNKNTAASACNYMLSCDFSLDGLLWSTGRPKYYYFYNKQNIIFVWKYSAWKSKTVRKLKIDN